MKIRRAGICATDIHILHDLFPKIRPPHTMGHEFCGVVAELGKNIREWNIGDRVTVESTAHFCGICPFCQSGQTQLCMQRLSYGNTTDGRFASFVCVRQEALHRLPEHIPFPEGALVEPLSCATHAVMEISSILAGKVVLVTGPGPIGLLVLQVAKAIGATVIITGIPRDKERLRVASGLGADHCFQVPEQDPKNLIFEITKGYGVDLAFECSGSVGGLNYCIALVRKRGEIIQVGLLGRSVFFNPDEATLKEIHIKGTFAHNHESWLKAIDLVKNRKVDLKPLISGEFPLDRWQEPFELLEKGVGFKYLLYAIE